MSYFEINKLRSQLSDAKQSTEKPRIRVAANAVIVEEGKALLVEFAGGTGDEHYNFPGGGVETGETLETGLRREVMEETRLDVEVGRLLLIVESVGARNYNEINGRRVPWNELRFFFLCTPNGGQARLPDIPDGDQTDVRWVALADLPSIEVLPQVSKELLRALDEGPTTPMVIPNPREYGR